MREPRLRIQRLHPFLRPLSFPQCTNTPSTQSVFTTKHFSEGGLISWQGKPKLTEPVCPNQRRHFRIPSHMSVNPSPRRIVYLSTKGVCGPRALLRVPGTLARTMVYDSMRESTSNNTRYPSSHLLDVRHLCAFPLPKSAELSIFPSRKQSIMHIQCRTLIYLCRSTRTRKKECQGLAIMHLHQSSTPDSFSK